MTLQELQEHRTQILALAEASEDPRPHLWFHSQGEAGPGSDIDIVVDMESGRRRLEYFILRVDLEMALGRSVDLIIGNGSDSGQEPVRRVLRVLFPLTRTVFSRGS